VLGNQQSYFMQESRQNARTRANAVREGYFLARYTGAQLQAVSCKRGPRKSGFFSHATSALPIRAVWPNQSLKRSDNGMPPGPGLRYCVHFLSPGPGVIPLSPA